MDNKISMLDEKMQLNNIVEERDVQFPLSTLNELTHFEVQLQDTTFKNQIVQSYNISYI